MSHTLKVPGQEIPTDFVRVLTYNDPSPKFYTELTGPEDAFVFRSRGSRDQVKVIHPESVIACTFYTVS